MKKWLIVGGAGLGAALAGRRCSSGRHGFDFEKLIERMPEDAPPKWMFRNISAIRDNTARILQLLEAQDETGTSKAERHAA